MRNHVLYSFLSLIGVSEWTLKKNKSPRSRAEASNKSSLPEGLCRQFSLNEILAATSNFDSNLVIGRGGSGTVYKGFINDGTLVIAVKRLRSRPVSRKKALEEFRNEVQLLCQLRHQHLVSLIGFCHEKDEKIIVYSYMNNGSLYDHLHGNNGYDPLPWKQRLEICIGAARGLHYLHIGAKRAIIHRDIKPQNILLDDQLVPKLSDFGLSMIGPLSMSTAPIKIELPPPLLYDSISTTIFGFGGTMGYLDPGFFRNVTLVTEKSDVYSFGVVLFEVLSGRKVFNHDEWFYQKFLIPWILECIKDGTIDHTIDPYLRGKISPRCLDKFMEIAFRCIHNEGNKRPSMGEVEATLELALELQIQADSEIKCIDPNGEYMYEQVLFSSSAFDISDSFAQIHSWKNLYGPHEIYNVESFKSEHSFETDEVISSDIEDLQHGR